MPCRNKSRFFADATCTPADITYPTDLKLLNEAHDKDEHIIDKLPADLRGAMEKSRDHWPKVHKDYLSGAMARRTGASKTRAASGKHLRYLKRYLRHIAPA